MKIITDSKGLEEPKDPDSCNVFNIYKTMANDAQVEQMRAKYKAGGFGYGHAKQELYELIVEKFGDEREAYQSLMEKPDKIEQELEKGAAKAQKVAKDVIERVREKLGY
jgi:tryptophanyl-tRNA synthetase